MALARASARCREALRSAWKCDEGRSCQFRKDAKDKNIILDILDTNVDDVDAKPRPLRSPVIDSFTPSGLELSPLLYETMLLLIEGAILIGQRVLFFVQLTQHGPEAPGGRKRF